MPEVLSPEAIAAERCRRDLKRFVREFWEVVEPGRPLLWNWHIDVICDVIQRCARNCGLDVPADERNAIITVPPGSAKSLLVSVLAAAWKWLPGNWPHRRSLYVSKTSRVSIRDSLRARDILRSDKYQAYQRILEVANAGNAAFRPWDMSEDQDTKGLFKNSLGGFRQALTVGAQITGSRGDEIVIDDPYDVDEVIKGSPERIRERMAEALDFYDFKLSSRLNDQARGSTVLIMQRLHEEDLVGVFLKREKGKYKHVNIPMEYEPQDACPEDPRVIPGALFFPQLFPQSFVDEKKQKDRLGQWSAQYQQRPVPAEGGLFKLDWFKNEYPFVAGHWRNNHHLPKFDRVGISADCAVKAKKLSDPSVFQVWGEDAHGMHYLLHQWRGRVDFPELCKVAASLVQAHQPDVMLVEEAGNGVALIGVLRELIPQLSVVGIVPSSNEDKVMRASNSTHFWEAGRVWIPADPSPFVGEWRDEHQSFPFGSHDDQVDTTSQWLNWSHANRKRFVHRAALGGVILEEPIRQGDRTIVHLQQVVTTLRAELQNGQPAEPMEQRLAQAQRQSFWSEVRGRIGDDSQQSLARFPEQHYDVRKVPQLRDAPALVRHLVAPDETPVLP